MLFLSNVIFIKCYCYQLLCIVVNKTYAHQLKLISHCRKIHVTTAYVYLDNMSSLGVHPHLEFTHTWSSPTLEVHPHLEFTHTWDFRILTVY